MSNINFYYPAFTLFAFLECIIIALFLKKMRFLNSHVSTLKKESEKVSQEMQEKQIKPLGRLFSSESRSMVLSVRKNGVITEINSALLELLGYKKNQLIGKNIYGTLMVTPSKKEPLEMNIINRIFKNPSFYTEYETELITKNGNKIWISWTNKISKAKKGNMPELCSVGFDITKRKKLEEEVQFIASKDPQTGVLNRLALLDVGTRELKRSIRYKHHFSVLALRLLSLNNELSSQVIEELLKQLVSFCKETIRDTDYLGRIGEAEFILLLPETEEKNVHFLQKRLEEKIMLYNKKKSSYPITVSFGTSSYNKKIKSIDELISSAISDIQKRKTK